MKFIFKTTLAIIILNLKLILINCSKPPSWFIHDTYLYYINIEQKFTSNFTQNECLKKLMPDTITQSSAVNLLEQLKNVYGDFAGLWTYKNELNNNFLNAHIKMSSCFVLNTTTEIYEPKICSERFGFICKVRMKSATIFYNDKPNQKVYNKDIQYYCNPHETKLNDINSCLIHLF